MCVSHTLQPAFFFALRHKKWGSLRDSLGRQAQDANRLDEFFDFEVLPATWREIRGSCGAGEIEPFTAPCLE